MDVKFHIPVLSDILNLLGIADFSVLDLILLPAAFFYRMIAYFVGGHSVRLTRSEAADTNDKTRIPDQAARGAVCAFQVTLFVVESVETVCSAAISLSKSKSSWAEGNPKLSGFIGILLTGVDFGLSYGSGCYYSPMAAENFLSVHKYTILWYAKSALSVVISGVGMFRKKPAPFTMKLAQFLLNLGYCGISIATFVLECIAIDNARTAECPQGSDSEDFERDRAMLIVQASSYLVDDLRNVIDGIMGMIEAFENSAEKVHAEGADVPVKPSCASQAKAVVYVVRAVISELYALAQLALGIIICAFP